MTNNITQKVTLHKNDCKSEMNTNQSLLSEGRKLRILKTSELLGTKPFSFQLTGGQTDRIKKQTPYQFDWFPAFAGMTWRAGMILKNRETNPNETMRAMTNTNNATFVI